MRMPRYHVTNDGMGPYAVFYCDRCHREYRSQTNVVNTIKQDVAKNAFGGLLRNIPVVGNAVADNMENDRYRTNMTQQELNTAWDQVRQHFRECPTCHEVVCIPDFDEISGYCDEHSPRRQEIAEAQAEQTIGFMKGVANAFGIGDVIKQGIQQANAGLATCQQCGNKAAAGTRFCPNCGGQMTQPVPQPQGAAATTCSNCGSQVPAGQKFCGGCGSPVQQALTEARCPSCGTVTTSAFCGNCGTRVIN